MKKRHLKILFLFFIYSLLFFIINLAIKSLFIEKGQNYDAIDKFILINLSVFMFLTLILFAFLKKTIFSPLKSLSKNLEEFKTKDPNETIKYEKNFFLQLNDFFLNTKNSFIELYSNVKEIGKSKEYTETIMQTVNIVIIILDNNLYPIYVNEYGLKKLKISKDEVNRLNIFKLIDKKTIKELTQELSNKNNIFDKEAALFLKNGEKIDISISISKLLDSSNKIKGYISAIQDITKRKIAEKNLKSQIYFSREIFKSIPDIILITDINLKIIFANHKAEEFINKSTMFEKNIKNFLSNESLENGSDDFFKNAIKNGDNIKNINIVNPFKFGANHIDLIIQPLRTKSNIIGSLILIRDVSEWRKLTSRLKDLQEFMGKLIDSSPFAIISIYKNNKVSLWNSSAEKLFQISNKNAIDNNLFEISPVFKKYKDVINEVMVLNRTSSLTNEKMFLNKKRNFTANLTFYPILNESENVVINVEDISEIKKLEDSLALAQKMGSLGLITSAIIHDFNNVLSGILGYASLIEKKSQENPELKKYISYIIASSERASMMIQQILNYSRKKFEKGKALNLNKVIEESLNFVKVNLRNIIIIKKLSNKEISIDADKTKISQIFINLFINSKDSLKNRPSPTIKIETEEISIQNRKDLKNGQYAMIKVTDNGSGIEKEDINKIFETFFTTKDKKGTGIGLSNVKEIVNSYNGIIEVKSEFGVGTSFRILIPSIKQTVYEPKKNIKEKHEPSIKGNVLLVDDEEVIREIGKDMLNSIGINCITACNGEEGIETYKKNRDKINIVILDVELPGISGEKVFDILKQINPDIKILIASGYGKDYLEKKIFQRKIKNFMAKPFQLKQLSNKLNELIKE